MRHYEYGEVVLTAAGEPIEAVSLHGPRFEREAKVLASLNHPNIGGISRLSRQGFERLGL